MPFPGRRRGNPAEPGARFGRQAPTAATAWPAAAAGEPPEVEARGVGGERAQFPFGGAVALWCGQLPAGLRCRFVRMRGAARPRYFHEPGFAVRWTGRGLGHPSRAAFAPLAPIVRPRRPAGWARPGIYGRFPGDGCRVFRRIQNSPARPSSAVRRASDEGTERPLGRIFPALKRRDEDDPRVHPQRRCEREHCGRHEHARPEPPSYAVRPRCSPREARPSRPTRADE
jgi:hypothetical protein